MCTKLSILLPIACLIILNSSSEIRAEESSDESKSDSNSSSEETETTMIPLPEARSDGYVEFPEVNASYKIFEENSTWTEARDRCIEEGATLAITDSYDKVRSVIRMRTNTRRWLHVGIHKSNTTSEWVRVDNDLPVTTVPWAPENPDDTGDCSGISLAEVGIVDYPCDWKDEHFVCEKPIQGETVNEE